MTTEQKWSQVADAGASASVASSSARLHSAERAWHYQAARDEAEAASATKAELQSLAFTSKDEGVRRLAALILRLS